MTWSEEVTYKPVLQSDPVQPATQTQVYGDTQVPLLWHPWGQYPVVQNINIACDCHKQWRHNYIIIECDHRFGKRDIACTQC